MPAEYRFKYCGVCKSIRRFRKRVLDHRFHAGLTAATLGLWGIIWAVVVIRALWTHNWRCSHCHHRYRPDTVPYTMGPLPNPDELTDPDVAALEALRTELSSMPSSR
jgi:hypothetical protein